MDLAGKVAIVTGGASGLGQATVEAYVSKGVKVAIFDLNEQGLQDTTAGAGAITAYRCDISSLQEVEARVAEVMEQLGPVDPVSYTHLTLPTTKALCRSRWSPYH